MATATEQVTSTQDLAEEDSREGDGPAKIELTYSTLQAINRARLAFDMPALRIIQVSVMNSGYAGTYSSAFCGIQYSTYGIQMEFLSTSIMHSA